ncbi:hypothetical protein [Tannockella kyphosi]|uniref:hypothetical protein n=1 Tax=Tannockella kyphosi TaxID=2899121 RepID=UPI002011592E|nr:hypothetical protein [Tannockella kyphosi]
MKKIRIMLITTCMGILSVANVYASEKTLFDYTAKEIAQMQDEEYLTLYTDYYIEAKSQNKTEEDIKIELQNVGIDYSCVDLVNNSRAASFSTDIDLNITLSRRSGQTYTYVTGVATSTKLLSSPSTEDMLSIEWEPSKGTYYGYTETKNATLKNYSKKSQGILVFNIQDSNLVISGSYALCSVKVVFDDNTDVGDLGLNYIHTFTDAAPTLTIGGNVSFTSVGALTGGLSIGLTITNVSCVWERSYLYS